MTSPSDPELESAKERGWHELAEIDAALERGEIDEDGWHAAVLALVEPAYLAGQTPQSQSGKSGDARSWELGRRLILDAVDRDGTLLDIGCANGLLMESIAASSTDDGHALEPYGVDISAGLAHLARDRCPQWADRIWTANAATWRPPRRFDFVRTGLDYVPDRSRRPYVGHLLTFGAGRSTRDRRPQRGDRPRRPRRCGRVLGPSGRRPYDTAPPAPGPVLQGLLGRRLTGQIRMMTSSTATTTSAAAMARPSLNAGRGWCVRIARSTRAQRTIATSGDQAAERTRATARTSAGRAGPEIQRVQGDAAGEHRQRGAHPGQEGALVGEREARVGLLALRRRPSAVDVASSAPILP